MSIKIALAGNPNCGKTTLFNALTGSNQFVGNWPGVTVEKKEGKLKGNKDVTIMDLPGIYSLSPYTLEEVVARNYLITERPDAILNIVDGTNIERNLYLSTQLMELGIPVVMAVNMMDIVTKNGDNIYIDKLGKKLGCEVVEISALKGTGIMEAANKAVAAASKKTHTPVHEFSQAAEAAIASVSAKLGSDVAEDQKRFFAVKLLEKDDFYPCMQSWGADLYAVMLEEKCVGYLNASADGSSLYEIGLLDEQLLPAVIYAYMQEMDIDELGINVGMDETAKLPLLDHISDYYTVSMSHQIRILQYESVIAFLLHWKRQYTSLQEGTFVLGIKEDQNTETIKITITEKDICVEKTTEPAQIMYDSLTLVKELTTSYYYIAMQSKESALYQAPQGWFPLPFFLPEADAF